MATLSSTSRLTTTSYAVLGLLSLGDWTAYELAKLMERSVGLILPRAPSVIYEEPKRLARRGMVKASTIERGQRRQVVRYHITADGRAELQRWTSEAAGLPALDAELIVKMLFASGHDVTALHQHAASLLHDAKAQLELLRRQSGEYLDHDGPFPERLPIIALTGRFVVDYHRFLATWADWAREQLAAGSFDKRWGLDILERTHAELVEATSHGSDSV